MDCCICFDKTIYCCKTGCGHYICACCLFKMIKTECPICRADLKKELPQEIKDKIKINYRRMYPTALSTGLDIASQTQFPPLRRE